MRQASISNADMGSCCSSRGAADGGQTRLGREVLVAHNAYRSSHAAPPLRWSSEAAEAADRWARRLASLGKLEHDSSSGMGQNLYRKTVVGADLEVGGQEVVDSWYGEISSYDFSRPGFSPATGHFTQVVWAGTTHMGAASARRGNSVFVVANYTPPGNVVGQQRFSENVKRKI